jgi:hypothetical protein
MKSLYDIPRRSHRVTIIQIGSEERRSGEMKKRGCDRGRRRANAQHIARRRSREIRKGEEGLRRKYGLEAWAPTSKTTQTMISCLPRLDRRIRSRAVIR